MVFFRLGRWFMRNFGKHPWETQMITAGCITTTGDLIAQFVIEKRSSKEYNFKRTVRFFGFGCFYFAPTLRTWFAILNRYVHWRAVPQLSPLLRVAIDQLFFAPCLVSTFLVLLRLSEGNNLGTAGERWRHDILDVYGNGLRVWPITQIINFYFIPVQFQMLVVQTVALFWHTYLAWRTNRHKVI